MILGFKINGQYFNQPNLPLSASKILKTGLFVLRHKCDLDVFQEWPLRGGLVLELGLDSSGPGVWVAVRFSPWDGGARIQETLPHSESTGKHIISF